ncbi:MAG: HIT domain-containing protein [Spirochaetaceae bacterium]|jgi:ATP adenylyltransferase|nr:HIT domain-containing protein [Spirochaetaceae bacterium]
MEYFFNFEKIAYVRRKKDGSCILCRLRDGDPEVTHTIVYRTELCAVSVNLYPYNPGHLIIYPLRHVEDLRELEMPEKLSLDDTLGKSLNVLDKLYSPSGYNIGCNMGPESGASIPHLHFHIIPRYPRELGMAELIGGKRVLVEDINRTSKRLLEAFKEFQDAAGSIERK